MLVQVEPRELQVHLVLLVEMEVPEHFQHLVQVQQFI
jgi:hypothetical protein